MMRSAAKVPYLVDSVMAILRTEGFAGVNRTRVRKVPAVTLRRIVQLSTVHKGGCYKLLNETFRSDTALSREAEL